MAKKPDAEHACFGIGYKNGDGKIIETSEGATSFCFVEGRGRMYRPLPEVWLPYPRYKGLIDIMEIVTVDAYDEGRDDLQGQLRSLLGVDEEIEEAVNIVRRSESS